MKVYVGIDCGGSKTAAVVSDETGKILGKGLAGAGNPLSVGIVRTVENIVTAVKNALSTIKNPEIHSVFIGMAGGKPKIRTEIIKRLKLTQEFRKTPYINVDHDLRTALYSGLPNGDGIVLIVGTGSCAFGVDKNGKEIEVSGWNHWLGETGGYELGIKAILAATRHHDGRGPKTVLRDMIQDHLKLDRFEDISIVIKSPTVDSPKIASLSPLVIQAVKQKDKEAMRIVDEMISEMDDSIRAAVKRVGIKGTVKVVLVGGIFNSDLNITHRLGKKTKKWTKDIQFIKPIESPSVTALKFAIRHSKDKFTS